VALKYKREGNVFFITLLSKQDVGTIKEIKIFYNGKPKVAVNPPWRDNVEKKTQTENFYCFFLSRIGRR
jgi:hypothetical protein